VVAAARAVAFSVLDLMTDTGALAKAADEFRRRAAEGGSPAPYIPADSAPPVDAESVPPYVREHLLQTLLSERQRQ
jgi:hypothetical protein